MKTLLRIWRHIYTITCSASHLHWIGCVPIYIWQSVNCCCQGKGFSRPKGWNTKTRECDCSDTSEEPHLVNHWKVHCSIVRTVLLHMDEILFSSLPITVCLFVCISWQTLVFPVDQMTQNGWNFFSIHSFFWGTASWSQSFLKLEGVFFPLYNTFLNGAFVSEERRNGNNTKNRRKQRGRTTGYLWENAFYFRSPFWNFCVVEFISDRKSPCFVEKRHFFHPLLCDFSFVLRSGFFLVEKTFFFHSGEWSKTISG